MDDFSLRVVLVDDHPALLAGVAQGLSSVGTIQVTGMAGNSTELVRLLEADICDVLVSDYSMPGNEYGDGINLFSFIRRRYPSIKLVVLTMMENPGVLNALRAQGIRCLVSKADGVSNLIPAIHAAATGGTYYSPAMEKIVHTLDLDGRRGTSEALSKRELEVLRLYASGMTVNEIAERVNRSKKTISTHKARAMQKLGIERDVDLLRYAIENGIVASPSQIAKSTPGETPQR